MLRLCCVAMILACLNVSAGVTLAAEGIEYPKTRRVDHVDTYFGVKAADPYRWLEEDVRSSQEVRDWVSAENKVTFRYLESIPERKRILRRLTELWNYPQYSSPLKEGGRYYFFKNDGLQNQAVLYTQDSLGAKPRVLVDPNQWSKDGTIALAGLGFSDDGRYLAYGRSEAGSDWCTWHVMEIASGACCPTSSSGPSSPMPRGPRTAWVSSTAATRSPRRGPSSRHSTSTTSSTTTASARRKWTTCWSTSGPSIPNGGMSPR